LTSKLTSDQVAQLAPLLGSVARIVATGSPLTDSKLNVLLMAADAAGDSAALDELNLWAKLLVGLREQGGDELRHVTVEALLLRGLPEATVLLSVAKVVEGAMPESQLPDDTKVGVASAPASSTRLLASVTNLDFGMLEPRQIGIAEFDVQGGPGQVFAESDNLEVTPAQLGSASTRVRVQAKPVEGGVLWSSLKLVTAAETVELPVLAQWRNETAGHGVRPNELMVDPTGGGTHKTLAEALAVATSGTVINLSAGTHRVDQCLLLSQPVTLVGRGMDTTALEGNQGDCVLLYDSQGVFGLFDLTLRWTGSGSTVSDVVMVRSGEVQIERCRFSGATWNDTLWGCGLDLKGDATGRVANCIVEKNGNGISVGKQAQPTLEANICQQNHASGIYVSGQAQPLLEANTCRENQSCGIAYRGSGAGIAKQNTCSGNTQHGISVGEQAQPNLEANTCRENQSCGIAYGGSGAGIAKQNICSRNVKYGIFVSEQAHPTLEANNCRDNKSCGIGYEGSGAGTAKQNICSGNTHHGIFVSEQAQPNLEANTCQQNEWAGIGYGGSGAGTAKMNTCSRNVKDGIFVSKQAHPTLEANTCRENQDCGIAYGGSGAGIAKQNICSRNVKYGIFVGEQAQPNLEANTCRENKWSGIAYFSSASGVAKQNTCSGNVQYGIYVGEQAQPNLEANTCRENKSCGITYFGSASGVAKQNTCSGNVRYGIYVEASAQPALVSNVCQGNKGREVYDLRSQ
jgi:parallel beta-helix repeat protein